MKQEINLPENAFRELKEGEFSFILTAADAEGKSLTGAGAYSETVENDEDGTITFSEIRYDLNDLEPQEDGAYADAVRYYRIE